MTSAHVSLRDQLKAKISDLLADAQMTCHDTEESLIALAVDLADYREEGAALYPRVVVCDDLPGTLKLLPGIERNRDRLWPPRTHHGATLPEKVCTARFNRMAGLD